MQVDAVGAELAVIERLNALAAVKGRAAESATCTVKLNWPAELGGIP